MLTTKKRKATKQRKPVNKKRVRPWEDDPEEEIPHDDSIITIAELCKDLKRGRKSNTFKELELAKYKKLQLKRAKRTKKNNSINDKDISEVEEEEENNDNAEEVNEELEGSQQENYDYEQGNNYADNDEIFDECYNGEQYYDEGENYDNEVDHGNTDDYDQEIILDDLADENNQQENEAESSHDDETTGPIIMKRRIFKNRGSRFINDDGQYTMREEPKERREGISEDMEIIEEDKFSHMVNSGSYAKKPRRNERWTTEETELFYKSLSQWGTDFEIIAAKSFLSTKTRDQIKNKYKKERKNNPERVNNALDTRIPVAIEELNLRVIEEIEEPISDTAIDEELPEDTYP
ncbi:8543_t:CDS:2, partial [Cetraspora pellucida]